MKNIDQALDCYYKCIDVDSQHAEAEKRIEAIFSPVDEKSIMAERHQPQIVREVDVFEQKKEELLSYLFEMRENIARVQRVRLDEVLEKEPKSVKIEKAVKI